MMDKPSDRVWALSQVGCIIVVVHMWRHFGVVGVVLIPY